MSIAMITISTVPIRNYVTSIMATPNTTWADCFNDEQFDYLTALHELLITNTVVPMTITLDVVFYMALLVANDLIKENSTLEMEPPHAC